MIYPVFIREIPNDCLGRAKEMRATTIRTNRTRTVYGTDFPIFWSIYKFRSKWIAACICNGIADSAEEFKTKKDAVQYAKKQAGK
jgi:hypothetical protein